MQSHSFSISALTVVVLFALIGCQKDTELGVDITPVKSSLIGSSTVGNALHYANTVFYYREQTGDYMESPEKSRLGTYGASPKGLSINLTTGAIDVNKSESGLTYRVWFKPTGSSETVSSEVTIAGINFQSRLYNLASGDAIATPLYNVQNNQPVPLGTMNKAAGSEFANEDDKTVAALLSANTQQKKPKGVEINELSGAIDLRRAVANGVFGTTPINGTMRNFRLYYRLNDGSRKALNYIDVRLHYYSHASAVPASLLSQATYKTTATFRQATPSVGVTPTIANVDMSAERPTRPPDIIIVGN